MNNGISLTFALDKREYAICKLDKIPDLLLWNHTDFWALTHSNDEISLVCPVSTIPADAKKIEADWAILKILGVLEFSMIGIIATISALLKEQQISIFVISTFNTDYILLKQSSVTSACNVLSDAGYTITDHYLQEIKQ